MVKRPIFFFFKGLGETPRKAPTEIILFQSFRTKKKTKKQKTHSCMYIYLRMYFTYLPFFNKKHLSILGSFYFF